MDVLEHLLGSELLGEPSASLGAWLERLERCPFECPIDRALWSGFEADRLGYAFVGGYRAAFTQLFVRASGEITQAGGTPYAWPSPTARLSLAATENDGAHPRAIRTTLGEGERPGELVLRGEKTFATLASAADELLVVATRGTDEDGKSRLCLARVAHDAPGMTIVDRAPTPFAPEVPHARVRLDGVVIRQTDVLPGDGYAVYLKPFRTIEDTHVLASAIGHVVKTARAHRFDSAVIEGALAIALGLRELAARDVSDPKTHLALAGLFTGARRLISEHDREWDKTDLETRERWRRDLGLLMVAETARQKRTAAAWKTLGGGLGYADD